MSGDIKRQLPPISESWRFFEGAYVIKELANFNKIEFNYNFRTGLSGNILWDDWSLHPERFKVDNDAPITLLNICWTNKKRKEIINQLEDKIKTCVPHKILTKTYDDDVWCGMFEEEEDYTQGGKNDGHRKEIVISVGCPLIAIKSIKEYGISKNEFRRVVTFDDDLIELDDGCSYEYDFIYHNFLSAYCITTHKAQGDTYKQRYTIHEWDRYSEAKKFNRRLRYVAQSRSTDPENNIVYKNRRSNQ